MYANAEVNGIGRQTLPDSETDGPSDSILSITAYDICAQSVGHARCERTAYALSSVSTCGVTSGPP